MCTLSYQTERHSDDEYRWVLFNRDELRTRPKALPPRSFSGAHGNYLMPVDPQGGGSWMGLHDAGFFVCLLNYYPNDEIILGPSFRSRGLLIRDILEAGVFPDGGYLDSRMKDAQYAPFYLAAFTGGEPACGAGIEIPWSPWIQALASSPAAGINTPVSVPCAGTCLRGAGMREKPNLWMTYGNFTVSRIRERIRRYSDDPIGRHDGVNFGNRPRGPDRNYPILRTG
jgi:hypothetical protein